MRAPTRWSRALGLVLATVLLSGPVPYTAPSGDLNLDGSVDVLDLQCEVLVFQALALVPPGAEDQCLVDADCAALAGPGAICRAGFTKARRCLPQCLSQQVPLGKDAGLLCLDPDAADESCVGTTQVRSADLNCDGIVDSVDVIFLVALVMDSIGGPGTADHDGDGQLNFCDQDSDGDSDPDSVDCGVLDETVSHFAPEVCNGLDENCNGKIDEYLPEVTCGVGECLHSEPGCLDGVPTVCNPMAAAKDETCNGLDDDCNGKVDDGSGDLLCAALLGAPNALALGCVAGLCQVTACEDGWFDTNGQPEDGCECTPTGVGIGNGTCMQAVDLGALTDVPPTQVLMGSNDAGSVGVWYRFVATDVDQGSDESFRVKVQFLKNPEETFVFDLHWNDCQAANRICSESTELDWFTDFAKAEPTDVLNGIPGPTVTGGGELGCSLDANHSLTPNDYSDDTSPASHLCADNTATFYLRVYVAPGKKPTCDPFKIAISNGVQ